MKKNKSNMLNKSKIIRNFIIALFVLLILFVIGYLIVINLPVNKRLRLIYNENKEGNIEIMPTNVTELFMDYEGSINQRSIYKAMYLFADEIVKSYYDKLKDYDDAQVKEYFSKNYNDIQRELRISDENEFISLTDIAKYRNEDDPRFVIQNWMRNRNTIEFLGVWEELHNPDFNRVQFEAVKNEAGLNRFVMTPTKWITQMNAIGIVSKAGRYGGTYAHSDIAMSFATWISPEFQLYIMKDYRRLKTDENSRLSLNWNLNREISKLNYRIHTDAIKDNLIPPELTPAQVAYTYANEADMLNVVLFGKTAKQWKDENPTVKGNMRDVATLNQLLVLANLESYNAVLINQGKNQKERMELLRQLAVQQLKTLETVSLNNFPKLGTDLQKV